MRAKFSDIKTSSNEATKCCCSSDKAQSNVWLTAEQIEVKTQYTASDLEGMEHLNYAAGIAPFLRGP